MGEPKPFRRTWRPFVATRHPSFMYFRHAQFAESPEQYVRVFLLLQKDMIELFEYVEPSDTNLNCYSYRIHSLLMRVAIEVEANCRAILIENKYPKKPHELKIIDFHKLEASHKLSSYEVRVPVWHGQHGVRKPFAGWTTNHSLPWYQAYNIAKHDRHKDFSKATFEHTIDAMCGLAALISSQFYNCDFTPNTYLAMSMASDDFQQSIGDYFQIRFPKAANWSPKDLYDFDWDTIRTDATPFAAITF